MLPYNQSQQGHHHGSCDVNRQLRNQNLLDGQEQQVYGIRHNNNNETSILNNKPKLKKLGEEEEYDLINLMDDFCISPQRVPIIDKDKQIADFQLKMLEEFLSTPSNTKSQETQNFTLEQEIEFHNFFDKYEAATNCDKATNTELIKEEAYSTSVFDKYYNIETPKIVIPKLNNDFTEETIVNEDLIDELLLEKNLEKHLWRYPSNVDCIDKCKQSSTPPQDIKKTSQVNCDIMSDILINNSIDVPAFKLDEKAFLSTMLKNTNNSNLKSYWSMNKEVNRNSYPHTQINELVTKQNIKYLEAVKKDEKLFLKQNILKSDAEKINLTPGPTLYEKSAVLPQIMQRLTERKKVVAELTNIKRKLVLEVGPSQNNSINHKNQETIPKKETNLRTQSIPTTYPVPSKSNQIPATFVSLSSSNQNQIPAIGSNFNPTIAEKNEGILKKDVHFIPVEKLRALRRELAQQGSSNLIETVHPHLLQPPQLLTDNCNRERYLAYATSSLFADFVNGEIGKPK